MTVYFAIAAAAAVLVAYATRGPKMALGALGASVAIYVALVALITRSMP